MSKKFFSNVKLKNIVAVVISIMIATMLIMSVTSILVITKLAKNTQTLYNESSKNELAMNQIYNHTLKIALIAKESIIKEDVDITNELIPEMRISVQSLSDLITELEKDKSIEDTTKAIKTQFFKWHDSLIEIQSALQAADYKKANSIIDTTFKEDEAKMEQLVNQAVLDLEKNSDEYFNSTIAVKKRALIILYIIIGAGIIIGALSLILIIKIIARPIKNILEGTMQVSEGNLNYRIDYNSKNEFGILAHSVRKIINIMNSYVNNISLTLEKIAQGDLTTTVDMDYIGDYGPIKDSMAHIIDSLNDIILKINDASEQVSSGSNQVSGGSQALSQSATEQASAIQELSASISEISEQVKDTAQSTDKANESTNEASRLLKASNDEMKNMVDAMDLITETSTQISKIIKTIDDIAFQTNILALNAAVEAARAGSAGKGFAVVAEEVRNLAIKSADAAKNTTELIEKSLKAVNNGSEIAENTANMLEKVIEKSEISSNLVNQIAITSKQQSIFISQITAGVDQISAVVQTNSATAEESAAASEELSSQAELLKTLVKTFKLKDTVNDSSLDNVENEQDIIIEESLNKNELELENSKY